MVSPRFNGRLLSVGYLALSLAACVAQAAQCQFPQLLDATLDELQQGLDSHRFTSVDLTKAYLARIREVNEQLHAVNEINPDALEIAAQLDQSRADGNLGPLHGIPVLIKDNIATDDKMNNTAGSYALLGAKVPEDSTIAAKLRKAGAIILGKANLSQWANYRSLNTSSGWTAIGGQAIGPYFPGQDPSGSSSGSGVSSAIGLAWACLGSETAGSIVSPAEENNLVGIKPSVGLTSRYLVIPISQHQDTVGPMARTVKDAAHLLTAIAGKDKNDNYTADIPFDKIPDYVGACKTTGLKGKRIGVPGDLIKNSGYPAPLLTKFREAIRILKANGATVDERVVMPGLDYVDKPNGVVLGVDFVSDLPNLYLSKLTSNPNNINSVKDLLAYTQKDPREDYPERDTGLWEQGLDYGYDNTSPQFQEQYQAQVQYGGQEGLNGALKNGSFDALFMPADIAAGVASYLGNPIITVPSGVYPEDTPVTLNSFGNLNATAPNRPFGFAFTGVRFSEESLIGMAYAFEQKTLVRKTIHPIVVPKTELKDVVAKKQRMVRSSL